MTTIVRSLEEGDFRRETLAAALRLTGRDQENLFALARRRRDRYYPERIVQVRSVIEISNVCRQRCNFCNIGHRPDEWYRINRDAFLAAVSILYAKGRRFLMIQSGENGSQEFVDHVAECLRALKTRFPGMNVILCLGNLEERQYLQLKEAGAESYILKFETSSAALYRKLKPRDTLKRRLACIDSCFRAGLKVGSGDIVGLPGQTLDDLVDDLFLLGEYDFSMQSCSVFIPNERSRYRDEPMGSLDLTLDVLALMRIMYPRRLMPTTSSLEKPRPDGQHLGLMAGANTVTCHDGTPEELKRLFPIYSVKRFTPREEHLAQIVRKAGLTLP
ncbi:MAG: radical SAM protein [bacterium]|jgi:biotin synthase